jgi:RNA polymerase sigma factor (sigma-70 family)
VQRSVTRPLKEQIAQLPQYDDLPDPDVGRAVAALAPMQRAAVVLHYWEDRPVHEVAQLLDVSDSTVKQHLHRARHRLASLLEEAVVDDAR